MKLHGTHQYLADTPSVRWGGKNTGCFASKSPSQAPVAPNPKVNASFQLVPCGIHDPSFGTVYLCSSCLSVKTDTSARSRSAEHLSLCHSRGQSPLVPGQPPDAPNSPFRLAVRRHACTPSHIPDLDLSIQGAAQKIVACIVPAQ